MIWVSDKTGRLPKRPHYSAVELDEQCESVVSSFLLGHHDKLRFPIKTDDLIRLLERDAVLDLYAQLEPDLWGVTEFALNAPPAVSISNALSQDDRYENPFRTTLTHEYAHVLLHRCLCDESSTASLFDVSEKAKQSCKRGQIQEGEDLSDWAEWQARYCSGALLMPKSAVRDCVKELLNLRGAPAPVNHAASSVGRDLISAVVERFGVSQLAAKVRLSKLGFLAEGSDFQRDLLT